MCGKYLAQRHSCYLFYPPVELYELSLKSFRQDRTDGRFPGAPQADQSDKTGHECVAFTAPKPLLKFTELIRIGFVHFVPELGCRRMITRVRWNKLVR